MQKYLFNGQTSQFSYDLIWKEKMIENWTIKDVVVWIESHINLKISTERKGPLIIMKYIYIYVNILLIFK